MEVSRDRQLILPIWHNVSQADVMGYSPSLASKLAHSTADLTVEQIAAEVPVALPQESAWRRRSQRGGDPAGW